MQLSFDDYLQAENQRYQLVIYRETDDQRILQSDWTRDKTCLIQPKMVDPDATFPWWLSPCKTSKTTIDSFDTYWWSKNLGTWLYQKHNWPHTTNSMFTLYQIIVIPVWKSYQKGFPFTLQHRFASSFSYRIVTIMLRSQKWLCYVSDRFSERYFFINLFQPSVAFHIEISHLLCKAKQMTGFYMERNTGLKSLRAFKRYDLNGAISWFNYKEMAAAITKQQQIILINTLQNLWSSSLVIQNRLLKPGRKLEWRITYKKNEVLDADWKENFKCI